MKKFYKPIVIFILGIVLGYHICYKKSLFNIFKDTYKAFQVGVYTNYEAASLYSTKYDNSIIIKDNELYRVYVSILKDPTNIENMTAYLNSKGIDYYLKEIEIKDIETKKEIKEYENIMDSNNELVFLEINKMIMETYKESL